VILKDRSIPDTFVIMRIEPIARERGRSKQTYQANWSFPCNSVGVSDEEDEEEGTLVNGSLETMLKQLIKSAS